MHTVNETIKDLFYLFDSSYKDGLSTSVSESGRIKLSRLLECSLLNIDICITKLKVDKKIIIKRNFVVEVN